MLRRIWLMGWRIVSSPSQTTLQPPHHQHASPPPPPPLTSWMDGGLLALRPPSWRMLVAAASTQIAFSRMRERASSSEEAFCWRQQGRGRWRIAVCRLHVADWPSCSTLNFAVLWNVFDLRGTVVKTSLFTQHTHTYIYIQSEGQAEHKHKQLTSPTQLMELSISA